MIDAFGRVKQRLVNDPISLWRPMLCDAAFLFSLGFIGGALTQRIEVLLMSAGASIARGSQRETLGFALNAEQQGVLLTAAGLQLTYFLVVYILFSFFTGLGWHWAVQKISVTNYLKRFFLINLVLLLPYIFFDGIGFYRDFLVLSMADARLWTLLYWLYGILLLMVAVIASVFVRWQPWSLALKSALQHLRMLHVWRVAIIILSGFVLIEIVTRLLLLVSHQLAVVVGFGLLFPYLALTRLFVVEVFS